MSEENTKTNNNFALGKGLASLIPQNKVIEENHSGRVLSVPLDKIQANPYQPRKEFNAESLQELADSIKMHGILEPLIVTKKNDSAFELVAGERRLRAAKLAKLAEVPVIVKEADNRQKIAWALTENLQREDLDPIEEAFAYKFLRDEYGLESPEIAAGFSHKSDCGVRNILRLLKLPKVIQDGVREKKIAPTCARVLLSLPREDQQLALYQLAIKANLSRPALEERVNRILNREKYSMQHSPEQLHDLIPEVKEAEENLSAFLKCRVNVVKSPGGYGKIYIQFKNAEMLDKIVKKIMTTKED